MRPDLSLQVSATTGRGDPDLLATGDSREPRAEHAERQTGWGHDLVEVGHHRAAPERGEVSRGGGRRVGDVDVDVRVVDVDARIEIVGTKRTEHVDGDRSVVVMGVEALAGREIECQRSVQHHRTGREANVRERVTSRPDAHQARAQDARCSSSCHGEGSCGRRVESYDQSVPSRSVTRVRWTPSCDRTDGALIGERDSPATARPARKVIGLERLGWDAKVAALRRAGRDDADVSLAGRKQRTSVM